MSPTYPRSPCRTSEAKVRPAIFQRPKRQYSIGNEQTPPMRDLCKHRADDAPKGDDHSIHDFYTDTPSCGSSLGPLPEIFDRGPPGAHRYANKNIFWTSIMVQASRDPVKFPKHQIKPSQEPNFHNLQNVDIAPVRHDQECLDSIREETHKSPTPNTTRRRSGWQPVELREDVVQRQGIQRTRTQHDLFVMNARLPDYTARSPTPPKTPDSTIEREQLEQAYDLPMRDQEPYILPETTSLGDQCVQKNEVLTWNVVLNRILANETVDPAINEAIQERVKASSTTNGSGHGKHPVTARAAGLVPNFSRPIYGSGFYSTAESEPQPASPCVNKPPTNEQENAKLIDTTPNGIHPSQTPPSTSPTSPPTPPYLPPRISPTLSTLLSSTLPPSSLTLYQHILSLPPSTPSTHLTHHLHKTLTTLHTHTTALTAQTTHDINTLRADARSHRNQLAHLKACIDYASKVLHACWAREWELWATLVDVRRRRCVGRSWLRRLVARRREGVGVGVGVEERWLGEGMPPGYYSFSSGGSNSEGLLGCREVGMLGEAGTNAWVGEAELDAVMLLARQNVGILREEVGEVGEMVGEYLRGNMGCGSWRDV